MGADVGPRDKMVVECVAVCAVFDYGERKEGRRRVRAISCVQTWVCWDGGFSASGGFPPSSSLEIDTDRIGIEFASKSLNFTAEEKEREGGGRKVDFKDRAAAHTAISPEKIKTRARTRIHFENPLSRNLSCVVVREILENLAS